MMKKNITSLFIITLLTFGLFSCDKEDKNVVYPSDISNIATFELPGQIGLTWDVPADSNYFHIKVSYFDHLLQKEEVRLASVHSDTLIIPDTRAKFGDYTFYLQPFTKGNTAGQVQSVIAKSGKAPQVKTLAGKDALKTIASQLSTNAQEPSEGPIAGLVDGKNDTYFHSAWSIDAEWPHWIQVNLTESIDGLALNYVNRNNSNGKPSVIDVMISEDGENWILLQTLKNLPSASASTYSSPSMIPVEDIKIRYVRFVVKECSGGNEFFSMAELNIEKVLVTIIDPEAE